MKGIFMTLLMAGATACCTTYTFTEFNTTGVVENFRPIVSADGDMMYSIVISKEEKSYAQCVTWNRFQIGDTVLIKAKMVKFK
jgi:hypothetical protein